MATEQSEVIEQPTSNPAAGWGGMIEERFKKMKEHAEEYPYVWASYAVVYGGFGLWFTYRWRRLRATEDRVRNLQKRLKELAEAEAPASSDASSFKPLRSSVYKPPK